LLEQASVCAGRQGSEWEAIRLFISAFHLLNGAIVDSTGKMVMNTDSEFNNNPAFSVPVHQTSMRLSYKYSWRGNTPSNPRIPVGMWANESVREKSRASFGLNRGGNIMGDSILSKAAYDEFVNEFEEHYCCCQLWDCMDWASCIFCCCAVPCVEGCTGAYSKGGYKYELSKADALYKYQDTLVASRIKSAVFETLKCRTLKEGARIWQTQFCAPVGQLLQRLLGNIPPNEVTLDRLCAILELYKCYVESDRGSSIQYVFDQEGFNATKQAVHAFLARLIIHTTDDYIARFVHICVLRWEEDVDYWVDRNSLAGVAIHPIGWYQIELIELSREVSTLIKTSSVEAIQRPVFIIDEAAKLEKKHEDVVKKLFPNTVYHYHVRI
jgi:hypothetical protein